MAPQFEGIVHHDMAVQQEHVAAAHMVPTVRKQREMDADAQLAFSFSLVQDPAHGVMLPTFSVDIPSSVKAL